MRELFQTLRPEFWFMNHGYCAFADACCKRFLNGEIAGFDGYHLKIKLNDQMLTIWAVNYPYAFAKEGVIEFDEKAKMNLRWCESRPSRKTILAMKQKLIDFINRPI